jgi:hypothetical protein
MSAEVFQFTATIPPNTPQSAPVTVPLNLGQWDIETIDIEVPPGPAGLMGFYLALSGEPYIPHTTGQWIVWDDVTRSWQVTSQPTSNVWQVVGYNLSVVNPHSVVVRFHVNPVTASTAVPAVVVNITTTPAESEPVVIG